ncbi:DExH-box splicing factor binding site-domain-containing protein [Aspergillus pseudodeflectus]|uniref:Pre-mRNA-splicing factor n=1 Tax=Aspergillus pseudodeflectus TaxID=176178 RepID=A0ABR4JDQ0_9EURO
MSSNNSGDQHTESPGPSIKSVSLSLNSSNTKKPGFSLLNTARQKSTPKPSATLPRRPHNLHNHNDDSDASGDEGQPAFESVTGFDTLTGKTLSADAAPEKKPLTIPVASGNNWRDRPGVIRRPKGKNLLPKEVQAMQEAQRKGVDINGGGEAVGPSMSYGLSFAQGATEEGGKGGDGDQRMGEVPAATVEEEPRKPLTEDEIALRALVRESKGQVEGRSDLVIESRRDGDDHYDGPQNETKSFRADVAARPESASLDQYNAVPVEEFGAALLRGMGWKEGQAVGKGKYGGADPARANTPHVPARRPGFLGIGAKDVSGGKGAEIELGAWGKSAMRKGSRRAGEEKDGERNTDGVYMPVLMRNKKTGETITTEELTTLLKEGKKRDTDDDWKERRDRNLDRNGRDRERDRDQDRDRGSRRLEYGKDDDSDRYDIRRNGSSRRDRSRSTSDRDSRRRKYEDDGRYYRERDGDRDRDRDRDRKRRSDRDRDRDTDRDTDRKSSRYYDDDRHSSRHSSSNTSSRHRDRDRDRDSDRDSHRRRKYDDR